MKKKRCNWNNLSICKFRDFNNVNDINNCFLRMTDNLINVVTQPISTIPSINRHRFGVSCCILAKISKEPVGQIEL